MTEVLIKRLSNDVKLPKYETDDSSGMDLAANIEEQIKILPGKTSIIPTGISLAVPKNFERRDSTFPSPPRTRPTQIRTLGSKKLDLNSFMSA